MYVEGLHIDMKEKEKEKKEKEKVSRTPTLQLSGIFGPPLLYCSVSMIFFCKATTELLLSNH